MRQLTQAMVRDYVRVLGGTLRRDSAGDLVLRFSENEKYFTTDLDDVLGTARCMKGSHHAIEQAEHTLALTLGISGVTMYQAIEVDEPTLVVDVHGTDREDVALDYLSSMHDQGISIGNWTFQQVYTVGAMVRVVFNRYTV